MKISIVLLLVFYIMLQVPVSDACCWCKKNIEKIKQVKPEEQNVYPEPEELKIKFETEEEMTQVSEKIENTLINEEITQINLEEKENEVYPGSVMVKIKLKTAEEMLKFRKKIQNTKINVKVILLQYLIFDLPSERLGIFFPTVYQQFNDVGYATLLPSSKYSSAYYDVVSYLCVLDNSGKLPTILQAFHDSLTDASMLKKQEKVRMGTLLCQNRISRTTDLTPLSNVVVPLHVIGQENYYRIDIFQFKCDYSVHVIQWDLWSKNLQFFNVRQEKVLLWEKPLLHVPIYIKIVLNDDSKEIITMKDFTFMDRYEITTANSGGNTTIKIGITSKIAGFLNFTLEFDDHDDFASHLVGFDGFYANTKHNYWKTDNISGIQEHTLYYFKSQNSRPKKVIHGFWYHPKTN